MTGAASIEPTHVVRRATVADAEGIARAHVRSWRTSYAGILPDEYLSGMSVEPRVRAWEKNLADSSHATWVATTPDGEIVGFCDAGPNRGEPRTFDGEIYAIYLLDEVQRRGLGRELFRAAAAWLGERRLGAFVVWVLAANADARRFYERLGGREVGTKIVGLAGRDHMEIAYGFDARRLGGG